MTSFRNWISEVLDSSRNEMEQGDSEEFNLISAVVVCISSDLLWLHHSVMLVSEITAAAGLPFCSQVHFFANILLITRACRLAF